MPGRTILIILFSLIALLITADILADYKNGAVLSHLAAEALVDLVAMAGIALLFNDLIRVKKRLSVSESQNSDLIAEKERWKASSRAHALGLAAAIEDRLKLWHLTEAETEVAFLLIKGFSLKEIADIRHTSDKTVRAQATAVYTKSGLAGRVELAAFFLEDLLPGVSQETGNLSLKNES